MYIHPTSLSRNSDRPSAKTPSTLNDHVFYKHTDFTLYMLNIGCFFKNGNVFSKKGPIGHLKNGTKNGRYMPQCAKHNRFLQNSYD